MKSYKDLVKRYPLLFAVEDSREPFAMFGFECGIGWYNIIEATCRTLYTEYKHFTRLVNEYKRELDDIENTIIARQSWDKTRTREWIIEHTQTSYDQYTKQLEKAKEELPRFLQIKEKFGTLRLYYEGSGEVARRVTTFAELMSEVTCEKCGNLGKHYHIGWNQTLCEEHAIERYGKEAVEEYNKEEKEIENDNVFA